MSIPQFDDETGYLPAGEHPATLDEVADRFGWNAKRRRLMAELRETATDLWTLGADRLWIDGSFVTNKERPGDVDVVYTAPADVDVTQWGRYAPTQKDILKAHRGVDLWKFPSGRVDPFRPGRIRTIIDIFCQDEDGVRKGLIRLTQGRLHVAERQAAAKHARQGAKASRSDRTDGK